ncbi:MAG TPA: hypothetical protein VGJ22_05915, partial [Anaerolineales bacterium]
MSDAAGTVSVPCAPSSRCHPERSEEPALRLSKSLLFFVPRSSDSNNNYGRAAPQLPQKRLIAGFF